MKATPEFVKETIQHTPGIDTLIAEDPQSNERVGGATGSIDVLCAHLDSLVANLAGMFRVKLSSSGAPVRRGRKKTDAGPVEGVPYVYILQGNGGIVHQVNGAQPVAAPAAVKVESVSTDLVRESATNSVTNSFLLEKIAALEKHNAELLDELEDEGETEPEAINAAPVPWWQSEQFGTALMEVMKPIGSAIVSKLAPITKPAQPVQATPEQRAANVTDEQKRLLIAVENFKKAAPEQADQYISMLLENFAAIPAQDEQGS